MNAGDLKDQKQHVVPDALRPEEMPGTENEERERRQRDLVPAKRRMHRHASHSVAMPASAEISRAE